MDIMRMRNRRHKTNPANANENLYRLVCVRDDQSGWNKPCDFFIDYSSFRPDISKFRTYRGTWKRQIGVQIIEEWTREVFGRIDMKPYILKNIASYTISNTEIHRAFEDAK